MFSDYRIIISTGENTIDWADLSDLIDNGVLALVDSCGNELTLFAERLELVKFGEYAIHTLGYIRRYRPEEWGTGNPVNSLMFTHPVIDYFFREDKQIVDRYIDLLNSFKGKDMSNTLSKREECDIVVDSKQYTLKFAVISQQSDKERFPFLMHNCIMANSENAISNNEILRIVGIIKSFLCFISHSKNIDLEPVRINLKKTKIIYFDSNDEKDTWTFDTALELKPIGEDTISPNRVFSYENMKSGLSGIFSEIAENQINFRNLFDSNKDKISIGNIVDACASFEEQFKRKRPKSEKLKLEAAKQKVVRDKMIANLEEIKNTYSQDELEHFESLITGFEHVGNTLKEKLEIALGDFIEIYGERKTASRFKQDYQGMPKRIKRARDAIAHGNHIKPIETSVFSDVPLLRAITYMLILKKAGFSDSDIIACIENL